MKPFFEAQRRIVLERLAEDPRTSGHALCESFTYAVDSIVLAAVEEALPEAAAGLPSRWALTALGGYGRREMCLRSDVDLQLVIPDGTADPTPFMACLLDHLSAHALRVGHGVRTISESLMLARSDATFATAALTSRHLAGDPAISETVRASVYHHLAGQGMAPLVQRIRDDRAHRAARLGETVFVLEPDLKRSVGGLRDAHVLGWLSRATGRVFDNWALVAEDTLLRARMALHAHVTFKCDRLAFDYQDAVAASLGHADADALMREVHLAMRVIANRARRAVERATHQIRTPVRTPLADAPDYVRVGTHLARADGTRPRRTSDVVAAMNAIVATGLPLDPFGDDGLEALSAHLTDDVLLGPDWAALVLSLLEDPRPGASTALHTLHDSGLLTRVIPEMEPILGRVQRDLYHVFTVDEHTLRAVDTLKALARGDLRERFPLATRLMADTSLQTQLAVATLLHDIGKGYPGGHHTVGADIARRVAPRLGLDADATALVARLVRHQADLALVCIRRDLSDPRPIRYIARTVGDRATLDALYLLTVADWSSVGPEAFTGWHQQLLDTLHAKTAALLSDRNIFADPDHLSECSRESLLAAELGAVPQAPGAASDAVDDFISALPTRYFQGMDADRLRAHFSLWQTASQSDGPLVRVAPDDAPGVASVTVVCQDRPGLLARLTGGLVAAQCDVIAAEAYSLAGGLVLDRFRVADPHARLGEARNARALAKRLAATVSGEARPFAPRPTWDDAPRGLPPLPASVSVSDEAASEHTVVDVVVEDRNGLLRDITAFLHARGLAVGLAFITTGGRVARDSFYIVNDDGAKLGAEAGAELARALETALAPGSPAQTEASAG